MVLTIPILLCGRVADLWWCPTNCQRRGRSTCQHARAIAPACHDDMPKLHWCTTITAANERTTACPYCQVSVFLPDELWKRMHPARTMQRWTLSYSGKLKTAEDLESDREEAMEEAEERRSSRERISMSRRRNKSRSRKGWIITLTSIVGLVIAYLFGGPHAFLACGSTGDHAMEHCFANAISLSIFSVMTSTSPMVFRTARWSHQEISRKRMSRFL